MTPTTVCNSDNTATITYVPSAGCSAEAYTVASICDYCDPDWIPSYTSCSVNVSAASLVGEFVGTALKSYSSGNPGCCAATGLNSDCKEPLDVNTNVACVLDYWSTQGKDAEGTSDTARYKQIFDPTGGCTASVSPELASNGLPIRPLVFDFDRDGETEVVVPTVAGFKTYDDDCSQEETTSVYSGGWEGGLSMTNFMAYSNSYIRDNYMMSEEYLSGSGGAFAGIATDALNKNYFVVYEFNVTTDSWMNTVNIDLNASGYSAHGAGVTCEIRSISSDGQCYFMTNQNYLIAVNPVSGSWAAKALDTNATNEHIVDLGGISPQLGVLGTAISLPGIVVVNGVSWVSGEGVSKRALYSCDVPSLSNCYPLTLTFPTNISQLFYSYSIGSGRSDNTAPVYITAKYYDPSVGYDKARVAVADATTGAWGNLALTPVEEDYASPMCVSNPAITRCTTNTEGVGVVTHFNNTGNTVTNTYTAPSSRTMPFNSSGFSSPLGSQTWVTKDRLYQISWRSSVPGFSLCGDASFRRISDNTILWSAAWCTPAQIRTFIVDLDGEAFYYSYTVTGGMDWLYKVNYANPGSILVSQVVPGTGYDIYLNGFADGYLFWQHHTFPIVWQQLYSDVRSVDSNYTYIAISLYPNTTTNLWSGDIWYYDSTHDFAFSDGSVIQGFSDYLAENASTGHVSALPLTMARGAYNQNYATPKYMATNGKKVTITSWDPFTTTQTSTLCSSFQPLYYNSEDYILGVQGGSKLAYCNYVDEVLPVVTNYSSLSVYGAVDGYYMNDENTDFTVTSTGYDKYYEIDERHGGSGVVVTTQPYDTYSCYVRSSGSMQKVWSRQEASTICKESISAFDVGGDYLDEIVSSTGIYGSSGKLYNFTNFDEAVSVQSVDVDSDTYMDFIQVSYDSSLLSIIKSLPTVSIARSTTGLSVESVRCSYDSSTNKIEAVAIGVAAANPTKVSFSGRLYSIVGTKANLMSTYAAQWGVNEIIFNSPSGGDFRVDVIVSDQVTKESETVSCNVTTPSVAGVVVGSSACGLGADGEFNYDDSLFAHGWYPMLNTYEPRLLNNQYVEFFKPTTNAVHEVRCYDNIVKVSVGVKYSDSGSTKVLLQGEDNNGQSSIIGGLWIQSGIAYILTPSGPQDIGEVEDDGEFHDYALYFNTNTQTYYVQVDDADISPETAFLVSLVGEFTLIDVLHMTGTTQIDYIRVDGVSGVIRTVVRPEDAALVLLQGCEASDERDFSVNPVGEKYYTHIQEYCLELMRLNETESPYCEMNELQRAVKYNKYCYKEAYDYCIDVTFPQTGSLSSGESSDMGDETAGATACQVGLAFGATSDIVLSPIWKTMINVVKRNWVMFGALVLILVVLVALAMRRN
jgi:hypothetical protein